MRLKLTPVALATVAALHSAWGQTAPLTFDVASVKPATPLRPGESRSTRIRPGELNLPSVSLRYCIAFAYQVRYHQISGPVWLDDTRYEIVAKAPAGTQMLQMREMLQNLLAGRFKLQIRRETKDLPGYALIAGKNGPKVEMSPEEAREFSKVDPGEPGVMTVPPRAGTAGHLWGKHVSIAGMADDLTNLLGHPVVDMTGLTGEFDFGIEFSPEDAANGYAYRIQSGTPPAVEPGGASIFQSIQKLGLKLEARKIPQTVITVDHAEKVPTEN